MDSTTLQHIRDHIKANEGTVSHPQLDSGGNITVGTGFNVDCHVKRNSEYGSP